MRYQWEDHPNRNMSTIHVDARLPFITGGCAPMRTLPSSPHPRQPTADAIVSITGVEGVSFAYHAATITKGTVFGWDEIRPAVQEIIRDAFDPGGELVEVGGATVGEG